MKARKSKKEPKCFNSTSFNLLENTKVELPKLRSAKSDYKSIENTCKKYLDDLNAQSNKFQSSFKDIENMSPDKILGSKYKQPTIFKD